MTLMDRKYLTAENPHYVRVNNIISFQPCHIVFHQFFSNALLNMKPLTYVTIYSLMKIPTQSCYQMKQVMHQLVFNVQHIFTIDMCNVCQYGLLSVPIISLNPQKTSLIIQWNMHVYSVYM